MQDSIDFIEGLKDDYCRLGRLLEVMDSGRWWTAEEPGRAKIAGLSAQAALIKAATDEIERVVGQIGS